ncbi:MAG: prepilin-type N-terminal cleavage/methylation domain-containing protein [Patescibacteria group bacterium]|nr:prepilin-type N-terminal cleavage/methylation domain-containing protein [Patescibacteria group bacterium]
MFNKNEKIKIQKQRGFTLIESLITIVVVAILFFGVYNLIIYSVKITNENKHRAAAAIIANQKIERIRNLPYDDVGTVSGMVNGVILDNETISQGGNVFNVNTLVKHEDDPFDGTVSDTDTIPTDYKSASVKVSWNGPFGQKNIIVSTIIAPKGIETNAGGGTLVISVFDANGLPVNLADVHIKNQDLAPVIDFTAESNDQGKLIFYGAPVSTEGYEITVTKTNYSTSSTTPRTVENPNPTKPNATIIEGQKTEISFAIDLLSDLTIKTVAINLPQNWRISSDSSGESQINARIAIDNSGSIYAVWQDYRQTSASKIYAQKYNSSGEAQWPNPSSPDDIVIATANNTILPDILADDSGNLYVGWHDGSTGNQEAYIVKLNSADGSDLWGGEKKINTLADAADQSHVRIALAESAGSATTSAVWQDNRDGDFDVYMQILNPIGSIQLNPEIKINTNPAADGSDQYEPVIAIGSLRDNYIAWTDKRDGDFNIYSAKYSSAATLQWEKIINTDTGTSGQTEPDITIDPNDNIYIVWTDERNGDKDIYAQKYDSEGNILWTEDLRINIENESNSQYSPSIAIDSNDNIYIVWTDERNGDKDIYAQKYDGEGNVLWTEDLRVNINLDSSAQYNPDITINPSTNKPFAAWQDDRNGDLDIYATEFDNYLSSGTPIENIPITITGIKRIGEDPIICKYNKNYLSDSVGNISLTDIEWDSYNIELQTGYEDYTMVMSSPNMPIYLPPNNSNEIILYLE